MGRTPERGEPPPRRWSGEGATFASEEDGSAVVGAALGVLDRDRDDPGEFFLAHPSRGDRRRGREDQAKERRRFAGEADVTETVGAVGGEVDLEDGVARGRERVDERGARLGAARGEDEDAAAVVAEAELRLAAEHALAGDAGDGALLDGHPLRREVGAERREDDQPTHVGDVGCAADDLLLGQPGVDGHEAEPRTRRVGPGRDDAGHEAGLGAETEGLDGLDLEAGGGQLRRDRGGVVGELGAQLSEPADGGFHARAGK